MPTPRLSPDKRRKVVELKAKGLSNEETAKLAGVATGTVSNVVNQTTPEDAMPDSDQVYHLRARILEQSQFITSLRKSLGEQREIADQIGSAVAAFEPYKRVPYKVPAKSDSTIIPVLKLSDWHIGEIINPAETEGFGYYDWEVAQRRALYVADKFIEWVNVMRHAYRIDEVRVFREGDFVSGDIHSELTITNEFPAPVAAVKAGFLLAEVVSRISAHFSTVICEGVEADNHGRMNPKPQAKQKSQNNWCYVTAALAEEVLKKHGNVEFRRTEGMKHLANVGGKKFLVMHGDGIKSSLGIPYYGLERDRAREATRRMNTDKGFDYVSHGHYHCFAVVSGNIIGNGSLSGTTEFDHSCGRHAMPTQVAFLVHPKHGVFNLVPFTVM